MLQPEIQTQQDNPTMEAGSTSAQPWSIEAYADSLMDELFEDVDRILEGGLPAQPEPQAPQYISLQAVSVPQIVFPPLLTASTTALVPAHAPVETVIAAGDPAPLAPTPNPKTSDWLERLLLTGLCLSTLAVALIYREQLSHVVALLFAQQIQPSATTMVAQKAELDGEAQFLDYLQRSLELLDQRSPVAATVATAPSSNTPSANLPTITIPAKTVAPPSKPQTVLERIYIPVYQPPQIAYATPPNSTVPAGSAPPTVMIPAPPVTMVPAPAPALAHTLVGILELGNRSAALFEVNGSAQRVSVGEQIASSGWTLVKVANKEIVVRRNGEVRSIHVGQKL